MACKPWQCVRYYFCLNDVKKKTNQQTITEHASLLRFDLSFNFGSSWKDQLNPCFGKNMKNTDNRAAVKRSYSKFQRPSVSQVRPAFMEKMPGVNFKEKRGEPYLVYLATGFRS